jgi:sulfite reductase (NADPH) flavoprotein alpha-component
VGGKSLRTLRWGRGLYFRTHVDHLCLEAYEKSFATGKFSLNTAFSRERDQKVYVQDILHQHATELRDLVLRKNAHVYVCGDASRMAKDVFIASTRIIAAECEENSTETADFASSGHEEVRTLV